MTYEYDLAVFIGRFQPYHNGHHHVAVHGLSKAKSILFLVGSANSPRSTRNPFTANERVKVIADCMEEAGLLERTNIATVDDYKYDDDAWKAAIEATVEAEIESLTTGWPEGTKPRIMLTGSNRDDTTFYLKFFPQWDFVPPADNYGELSATLIRNEWLKNGPHCDTGAPLPEAPRASRYLLINFAYPEKGETNPLYERLRKTFATDEAYREQWGAGPFYCADNVVVQNGHVLLIERGKEIGYGELAIPGGHLEPNEDPQDGAIRELFEETRIFENIADPDERTAAVRQHCRASERFDDKYRSSRAHVITTTQLFVLPDGPLPEVHGADDAKRAFWCPIEDLTPMNMFDDHYWIIKKMLKGIS